MKSGLQLIMTNGNVCVNEDIHYYDNDLSEVLTEWIRYGGC